MTQLEHPPLLADRRDLRASDVRRVVLRLLDGDVVHAGTASNLDGARSLALSLTEEIRRPKADWPRIGDRLIRPASVVSVDVVP